MDALLFSRGKVLLWQPYSRYHDNDTLVAVVNTLLPGGIYSVLPWSHVKILW